MLRQLVCLAAIALAAIALAASNASGQDDPKPLLQLTPPANHSFQVAAVNVDQEQIVSVGSRTALLWAVKNGASKPFPTPF